MSSPEQAPAIDAMVSEMMPLLLKGKAPANEHEAQGYYTTKDFANAIQDHTGVAVELMDVYQWLKANGYQFVDVGNLQFHWLWQDAPLSSPFPEADNAPASKHEVD